jgi:hypothetical protein
MGARFASRSFTFHTLVVTLRLKAHAENAIPDQLFEKRSERWPVDTPSTKEAYYIRDIFDGELYANSFHYRQLKSVPLTGLFMSDAAAKTAVRYAL